MGGGQGPEKEVQCKRIVRRLKTDGDLVERSPHLRDEKISRRSRSLIDLLETSSFCSRCVETRFFCVRQGLTFIHRLRVSRTTRRPRPECGDELVNCQEGERRRCGRQIIPSGGQAELMKLTER